MARILLILAVFLVACSAHKAAPQVVVFPAGEWTLHKMNGEIISVSALKKPVTLIIDSATNRASGYAGCNQYFSGFTLEGASVSFTAPGRTKMFCNETMDLEEKFLAALSAVNAFKTESNKLHLLEGDTILLEFEK